MKFDKYIQTEIKESQHFRRKIDKLHLLLIFSFTVYILMGGSTAYGYLAILGILAFFLRGDIFFRDIFLTDKKMTVPLFFIFLILNQTMNLDSYIFSEISESLLNIFNLSAGVTTREYFNYFEYEPTPFSTWLLFGFFGPVMEEMIFRGYIARAYRQYSGSKIFALLFTAIVFGGGHCSIYTSVPIFFNAFIMGYVAMEYGIIWTMIYHSIENFLSAHMFADVVIMNLPVYMREKVFLITYILVAICGAVIIFINRKYIAGYIRENIFDSRQVKLTLKSSPFIFYMAMLLFITISRINKL